MTGLGGHLRVKEHLQQEVAEFIAQLRPGAPLNGVEDLVGFFQRMPLDRVEGLLLIPGAAVRPAQTGHDGSGLCNGLAGFPCLRNFQGFLICHGSMLSLAGLALANAHREANAAYAGAAASGAYSPHRVRHSALHRPTAENV